MDKQEGKKLRSGFTTGTAAAAAAKAAVLALVSGTPSETVQLTLPQGEIREIPIYSCALNGKESATCTVIKEAGDDPDVTNGATIGARVVIDRHAGKEISICIAGGPGVGRVTKPGLEVPVGEAAINPVPRFMITQAVLEGLEKTEEKRAWVHVEVFVPDGEYLSKKTLNSRLGIVGGLSILGTTGIVKPLSHQAYEATIRSAVSVARAMGNDHLVFSTGRRSEKAAQRLFPSLKEEAFIQIGDYFQAAMDSAGKMGASRVTLAVFFGKALKMAKGVPQTHASRSATPLSQLAGWTRELGGEAELVELIAQANTARQAFSLIQESCPQAIAMVGKRLRRAALGFAKNNLQVDGVIFDFSGNPVFRSRGRVDS